MLRRFTYTQWSEKSKNFTNKEKIPLTRDIVKKHLIGAYFIGIYPLLEDNTSYFIAVDFDGKIGRKIQKSS